MPRKSQKTKLRNYEYISGDLVNSYFDQIRLVEGPDRVRNFGVSLSLTGPSVDFGQGKRNDEPSLHEKIVRIEEFFRKNGDLAQCRPQESSASYGVEPTRFVLETCTARKVVVPCKQTRVLENLDSFAVWISDPDPSVYVLEDHVWRGTFLFLVEGWFDRSQYHSTYSGCSALQFIMNVAEGRRPTEIADGEPLGRGSDLHPIDKLRRLGATASDQRRIVSLYRKRYVTNEQCYAHGGQRRRVNDLVGYPLYIADEGQPFASSCILTAV